MSRLPLHALQKKIFEKLTADKSGWAVSADVYDEVPEAASFPYVELGLFTDIAEGSKSTFWTDNTQTVAAYSQARGAEEVNKIADQVVQSLTADAILVAVDDSWKIVFARYDGAEVVKDVDAQGDTFRVAHVRIRFKLEDTTTI